MHAYADRRPKGITKDIQDLDWILRHYDTPTEHSLRIHDELSDLLVATNTEYSEAGAMLLGKDIARIHTVAVIEPLHPVFADFANPFGHAVEDILKLQRFVDDVQVQESRARTHARFNAFRAGLRA